MEAQKVSFSGNKVYSSTSKVKSKGGAVYHTEKTDKAKNAKVAAAAFAGAVLPIIVINALKKGNIADVASAFKNKLPVKETLKSVSKLFEVKNLGAIVATTTGSVLAGTLTGAKMVNTKKEKQAKYKEGIFEFANSVIPAALVGFSLKGLEKAGKSKSAPLKAAAILSSILAGMYTANKVSNKVNEKVFKTKDKEKAKRKFKASDIIAQVDDLASVLVLAKVPFASKLHIDKLLPLMYTKIGYEAGTAQKEQA